MNSVAVLSLFWCSLLSTENVVGFPLLQQSHTRTQGVSPSSSSWSRWRMVTNSDTENNDNDSAAAQQLLDRAAQLRAEIAALEGKSIEQVEQEAQDKKAQQLQAAATAAATLSSSSSNSTSSLNSNILLYVPDTIDDMLSMAARSIETAFRDGLTTQTVRLALVLPDESFQEPPNQWPGGAPQIAREAAKPLTQNLLRETRLHTDNTFRPPNITTTDIWDFDGSAWVTSSDGIHAMVLPNTDAKYLQDIEQFLSNSKTDDNLFLLMNPFWRNLDSWGINILQPRAKQRAEQLLFSPDNPQQFSETFVFLRLSVRGEDCVALKAYPSEWQLFAYLEEPNTPWARTVRLGTSEEEPTPEVFTELLNDRPEFKFSKAMRRLQNR